MGGYGSGLWTRSNAKVTTESQRRVDIRYMRSRGMLQSGNAGILSWIWNGRQNGSVRYRVERERLTLEYRYRLPGGEWEEVEEVIGLDRTACNFGGERIWMLCPLCHRRVLLLYGAGKYFLCRHCHHLTYATQQEREKDRLLRKSREIRQRLGGDANLLRRMPQKPKGMHWETYNRLSLEESRASLLSAAIALDEIRKTKAGGKFTAIAKKRLRTKEY